MQPGDADGTKANCNVARGKLGTVCDLTGIVAGCMGTGAGGGSNITFTYWYYSGTVDSIRMMCEAEGQTLVMTTVGTGGAGAGGSGGTTGAGGSGGGAGGTGGAAVCNTLTASGDVVIQTAATGSAPAPAGGTIANGTYVLTSNEVFPPGSSASASSKETLRITGNQMERALAYLGFVSQLNYSISTAGTTLTATATCPVGDAFSLPYTATATTLVIFGDATSVQTYTRQ